MSDAYDRMQRVSELAKLINGFPFDSSDFASDGDVPLVRIRDVLSEPFETYVPANVVPRNVLLRDDDVVIGMDGDFNSTLWRRGEAALNQRVCALRSVNGTDPRYLAYALPEHLKVINDLTWSTTVKHLTARQVRAIRLPEREAPEQRAIADFLDRETAQIDEFIEENERFIELLTERRAAVIAHAVTKGLDPDAPLRDSGVEWLGAVPERWEVTGLVRYARSVGGVGFPDKEQGLEDEELAFYKVNALSRADRDGHIRERWDTISRETARRLGAKVLPAGSLLMAKIGAALLLGRVRVSELECCIDNNMMAVVPRQGAETRFLAYSLQTVDFALLANPGAVPSLDMYGFMHHPMCFPPLDEQRAIAGYLEERTARIDEAIETAREGIALAKERRSALISAAVTGKLDVTEAA